MTTYFKEYLCTKLNYDLKNFQSPEEFVDICTQISLETLEITNKLDSKFIICDYTKKFIKSIQESEIIEDLNNVSKNHFNLLGILKWCDFHKMFSNSVLIKRREVWL